MSRGQQDMCTGIPGLLLSFDQLKLICIFRYKMGSLTSGHNVPCNGIACGVL